MHQCNDNRDIDSSQMNYHDLTLACSDFHLQPYSLMSENPVFSTDDLVENQSPARKMQLLRLFLIGCIDSGKVKGLQWLDKEKTLFKIPSKLAGQHDYDPQEDAKIFMLWSRNTGKYKEGIMEPEPAVWKTRLRTALNKLPDIEEIREKTQFDIPEPYRVYKLHPKNS
ncbi:interferon regulatory factor 4-like [Strongylocentrotus purpuratus]|uniref:IRF tryptophan pentad repeat domain-containing protein n=1 Tax=Strongylocentrotus purpuratus TaxID=7668 RepID=A0A7M7N5F7_STRPU|nr:interferon regulatory factor 4-like [Strongylocentrotus purpuratus]